MRILVNPNTTPRSSNGTQHIPGLQVTIETVSPAIARGWLDSRAPNRKIDQRIVDILKNDMDEGRWCLTHQGIAFYDTGELFDGQHRLEAIVLHGKPVTLMVTRGVPRSAAEPVDQGRVRTYAQALGMAGVKDPAFVGAVARCLSVLTSPTLAFSSRVGMPTINKTVAIYSESIQWAVARRNQRLPAPYAAVAVLAYQHEPESRQLLEEFHVGVETGAGLDANDPRLHLRNTLLSKRRGGSDVSQLIAAKTISALDAWLNQEPCGRLIVSANRYKRLSARLHVEHNRGFLAFMENQRG